MWALDLLRTSSDTLSTVGTLAEAQDVVVARLSAIVQRRFAGVPLLVRSLVNTYKRRGTV